MSHVSLGLAETRGASAMLSLYPQVPSRFVCELLRAGFCTYCKPHFCKGLPSECDVAFRLIRLGERCCVTWKTNC